MNFAVFDLDRAEVSVFSAADSCRVTLGFSLDITVSKLNGSHAAAYAASDSRAGVIGAQEVYQTAKQAETGLNHELFAK